VDGRRRSFRCSRRHVHKDVSTQRHVDYSELYDDAGDLLAVTWFDKFGIQRTAVDRGIVEEADKFEGVFVVILEGETYDVLC
jgi:hypothetical protein